MMDEYRELEKSDLKYIWHPFTQMRSYASEKPVIIERGEGCFLIDIEGNRYIDGVSSLWTNVHGHRKAELDLALTEQIEKIAHSTLLGLSGTPSILLAKKLVEISPERLARVFYSDNGSTAAEIAVKIAFQYQRQAKDGNPDKKKFIKLSNGYHGDTIGSVSVGGIDLFHSVYGDLLFQTITVESPYCYRCPFGRSYPGCSMECLGKMEETIEKHHNETAALMMEPIVQGAGGILVHPPGYLKGIRELCDRFGIFLITDEVAVGFGRTGTMFACEHEGVSPDIMTVAKGITGGYLPLAATLASERIYEGFLGEHEEFKTFFHGHTYTGNALACAVAIANLEVFEKEDTIENLQPRITRLAQKLKSFRELRHVGDVRQRGFMVGIELVADRKTKACFDPAKRIGHKVIMEARKRGVIIRPLGDVVVLMPPLSISAQEMDRLCDVTYESIRIVTEGK